jgi:hypothetical protein
VQVLKPTDELAELLSDCGRVWAGQRGIRVDVDAQVPGEQLNCRSNSVGSARVLNWNDSQSKP